MRSSFALILSVALLAPACSKKKETPAAQQPPAAATESPEAGKPAAKRPPPTRRALGPITVDEVQAMIPKLEGLREIKPVQKAQVGERVETAMCADAGEVAALAETVKAKLTEAGWLNVTTRPHPTLQDRIGVSAQKQPYMLTGTVQRGKWAECIGDKGQTYIALGVHKLENRPMPMTPGRVGAPGPAGMRPKMVGPRVTVPPGATVPPNAPHPAGPSAPSAPAPQ